MMVENDVQNKVVEKNVKTLCSELVEDILDCAVKLPEDNSTEDVEDENQALNSSLSAVDCLDSEETKAVIIEDVTAPDDKEADDNGCYSWYDLFKDAYGSWGREENQTSSSNLVKPLNVPNGTEANKLDEQTEVEFDPNEEVWDAEEVEFVEDAIDEDLSEAAAMNDEFNKYIACIEEDASESEPRDVSPQSTDVIKVEYENRNEISNDLIEEEIVTEEEEEAGETIKRRKSVRLELKRKRSEVKEEEEEKKNEKYCKEN